MKSTLLVLCAALLTITTAAQTKITGTVSDDFGQLPLVNIAIKNSKQGTSSNDDGHFFIEAKSTDTLKFSYLGYKTKEIVVGKSMKMDVVFDIYEELDEVVIYGYKSRTTRCGMVCTITECYFDDEHIEESKLADESKTIKLYPNPSKDGIFTMKLLEDVQEVNIIVADLTGRIVLNTTEHKFKSNVIVDLSNQPTGIYIINMSSNGTQIASKKAIRM